MMFASTSSARLTVGQAQVGVLVYWCIGVLVLWCQVSGV